MNKYYAVLGLPATASKDDIRKKYRQLVLKWHPDRNPSPEAQGKFIAITEAYDVLMGERPAPRVFSKTTYQQQPGSRDSAEARRNARQTRAQQLRLKFENMRQTHLRAPDRKEQERAMYRKAYFFFIAAGSTLVVAIAFPLIVDSPWNMIWTIPLAVGGGMRLLWQGGRHKLRADMIYGKQSIYPDADIAEFFTERTGFKYEAPSGPRWP